MKAWELFLSAISKSIDPSSVQKWLQTLKVVRFDAANLYLEAQDSFQIAWFEEHIRPLLAKRFVNNNHRPIAVHLSLSQTQNGVKNAKPQSQFSIKGDPIDPALSFAELVKTDENAILLALLEQKNSLFNPLYLYGPLGCGKTHLSMALANSLQSEKKKAVYVRAESFTHHVVQAIRLGRMHEFRRFYRDLDALIIDDIEVFAKKDATQEEFFHTFNSLHTEGKMIVLTSCLPPSQLSEIEPRLISRFEWGLSLHIQPAPARAIIEAKARHLKLTIPSELVDFLLSAVPSNPVLAFQLLLMRSKRTTNLTPQEAKSFLVDLIEKEKNLTLDPEKIIKSVASHFGIKPEDLTGSSQMKEFVLPRQIAMHFCRKALKLPYQGIGSLFERNHSTVMASIRQAEKWGEENKGQWAQLEQKLAEFHYP